jgi:hypothetical protein
MEAYKIIAIIASSIAIIGGLFKGGYWVFSVFESQRKRIEEAEKTVSNIKAEMDLLKQIIPALNQIIEEYNNKREK